MSYLVAGIFLVGAVVSILAVVTARRGQVTHGSDGYGAPEHVRSDPALRRRANEIVEWWGTLLTALFLARSSSWPRSSCATRRTCSPRRGSS
jgi:hypothetical protein